MSSNQSAAGAEFAANEYVTVRIEDQLFGLPIHEVQDVFTPSAITKVPLSSPEIEGVLNLRGRIVTAIDLRTKLGLPPKAEGEQKMAVGIDYNGESYGLIIDKVGEVHRLKQSDFEPNPVNLDPRWAGVSAGVYQLEGSLMVVFDVEKILATTEQNLAA